jgi:hypothetical protein
MRRLLLVSALAVSTAVLGACDPKAEVPNKPAPSPSVTATPAASPVASPVASPAKPGASPEVKKDDKGGNTNLKPAGTPKAK